MTNRTTAYDGDFRLIGQWPPLPAPQPRQHPTPYPMAPTTAAVWAIVSARFAELWPIPAAPEFDLSPWFPRIDDPLADVRAELQAWLNKHHPDTLCATESPRIALAGVSGRGNALRANQAAFR